MDVWLIYRVFKNLDTGRADRIESVEYCLSDADARKYSRLFDLQTPTDLKDRIQHKYYMSSVMED
jgi:hypothetical protein